MEIIDVAIAGAATVARPLVFAEPGMAYPLMFAIMFGVAWYRSGGDPRVSFLLALAPVLGRAALRYRRPPLDEEKKTGVFGAAAMFGLTAGVVSFLASRLNGRSGAVRYALFGCLMWLSASLVEWVLHKYVMHCTQHAPWMKSVPLVSSVCVTHHRHHLSVNSDMSMDHVENVHELVFDWKTTAQVGAIVLPTMFAWNWALGLRVPVGVVLAVVIAFTVGFSTIWNTVHPAMHEYKGPLPALLPRLPVEPSKGLLYRNHEVHHQIKGERKGNFNVVFLGADELLSTNRL